MTKRIPANTPPPFVIDELNRRRRPEPRYEERPEVCPPFEYNNEGSEETSHEPEVGEVVEISLR